MKTVCVVVLSLISVGHPAVLDCKKLVKPIDQGPDVRGVWYLLGVSSTLCWTQVLFNSLFVPSFRVNITSTEREHYYDANAIVKTYGICENTTVHFFYGVNTIYNTDDQKNIKMEGKGVLLQSGCPDCLIVKDDTDGILLLSRRHVITAEEIKEFETLAECSGLYKPQIFASDLDYENCEPFEFEPSEVGVIEQRVKKMFSDLFTCTSDKILYYPRAAYKWAQQTWASLW